ncbi:MAG: prepilin-type N-terminal cleavage/methylation domain-containing protein [bacterium]|nr:prepilin-type N-terminal cleavage/methylation domain-containing protein [bacterium]
MLRLRSPILKNGSGMTIIELMVVVAIISILGVIAVPSFLAYRNKSRVAAVINTAESMRTALAGYAVSSPGNLYPLTDAAADWDALRQIINNNGGTLKTSLAEMQIVELLYSSDNGHNYSVEITVSVPIEMRGHKVDVSPGGVFAQ